MEILALAVKAQIPIIATSTRDTMNFSAVLEEITGKKPKLWPPNTPLPDQQDALYWHRCKPKEVFNLIEVYSRLVKMGCTLIMVNPDQIMEPMFDAGEAPVPKPLLRQFVNHVTKDNAKALALMRGLGGCTIKETAELVRLTMARDASLTVGGLSATRKECFHGSQGLTQVETKQGFYEPSLALQGWTAREKPFFLTGTDPRLVPRGILATGPPGVGKTAAAKFIAESWGVPLFRLDVAGTKGKFVGQSEGNLAINLARADNEAECVIVLDEVEKLFSQSHDDSSGTTAGMLSQMLWWLAEHKSRVLTFMTTNNDKVLPKELYRAGRIDKVMVFEGMDQSEAANFAVSLLLTFGHDNTTKNNVAADKIATMALAKSNLAEGTRVSHASMTEAVTHYVKFQSLT
jgi:hypothetical protein